MSWNINEFFKKYNQAKFKGQAFTEYAMFLERYATLSGTSFLIALMNILFSLFFFFHPLCMSGRESVFPTEHNCLSS